MCKHNRMHYRNCLIIIKYNCCKLSESIVWKIDNRRPSFSDYEKSQKLGIKCWFPFRGLYLIQMIHFIVQTKVVNKRCVRIIHVYLHTIYIYFALHITNYIKEKLYVLENCAHAQKILFEGVYCAKLISKLIY